MDICNLKGDFKITELRQGVKNPERVNVYVNDKFAFSLDISQVVDYKIKKGLVVSEEQFLELKRASEFGKLYQRALEWVLSRPHSERECRDYLRRKLTAHSKAALRAARPSLTASEWADEFSDRIIEKLKAKGYLDDYRFAEFWVENRFARKGVSLKRLKMELLKKGIKRDVIDEVLGNSERSDAEEIKKVIVKKRAKYPDDQKLIAYLVRQGFDYSLVRELVAESSSTLAEE